MKKTILAAFLATVSACALASNYFLVVPVPNRTAPTANVQVSLNSSGLPGTVPGQVYAGFDFNSVLQVTGDPNFNPGSVNWSVAGGALPAGLTLGQNGQLTGTPADAGSSSFQVAATYKTKAGQQTYQLAPVARTYATLDPAATGSNVQLSGGNLVATSYGNWAGSTVRGTLGVSTGKWYWEATVQSGMYGAFGIASSTSRIGSPWADSGEYLYYATGNKFNDNTGSGVPYGTNWGQGDIIGIALDMVNGTLTFYKNGVSQGVAYSGLAGTYYPVIGQGSSPQVVEVVNFGATPLAYPVAGYNQGLYR